jgi:cellulose synthase/poly-beta-1,6-N-acetylglucosamine synthase-like glycosyltransferase
MQLIALSCVFFVLALHPFVSYPASLAVLRRLRKPERAAAHSTMTPAERRPSVSVCVCAYNEAVVIEEKARNLLGLPRRGLDIQLLVYVDGATDGTAECLHPFAQEITVVAAEERRGKSYGMRRLAGMATGDILVFSDANVMIAPDALERLLRYFSDERVGCVSGHLEYRNAEASDTSAVNTSYWRLEEHIKQLETDLGSAIGADGSLFAVRRDLYPAVPDDIIDDFYASLCLLCDGHRVVRAHDVRAYEHSVVDRGEEFRRKVRIACQAFNVHRMLWPRIRRLPPLTLYCYVSHKLLRWFAAPNLIVAAVLLTAGLVTLHGPASLAGVAAVGAVGGAAWAGGMRPARKAGEISLALLATALGVARSIRGERFQTWAPAQSIRSVPPSLTLIPGRRKEAGPAASVVAPTSLDAGHGIPPEFAARQAAYRRDTR